MKTKDLFDPIAKNKSIGDRAIKIAGGLLVGFALTLVAIALISQSSASESGASEKTDLDAIHAEAEALRAENAYYESLIYANELEIAVLQAEYELELYLQNPEDFQ